MGKNRNADRVTTGKSEKNLNSFPQTEGLLVENKNARRGDRMLMTGYHGCSSVCGTMQASSSTDRLQVCGGWIYVSPRRDEGIAPYKSLGNTAQFLPCGLSTAPAAAAPRSPYQHLELCGIAFITKARCCQSAVPRLILCYAVLSPQAHRLRRLLAGAQVHPPISKVQPLAELVPGALLRRHLFEA